MEPNSLSWYDTKPPRDRYSTERDTRLASLGQRQTGCVFRSAACYRFASSFLLRSMGFSGGGEMRLNIGGKSKVYRKGDRYFIPEGVAHSATFLTRVNAIDVFADPKRYKTRAKQTKKSELWWYPERIAELSTHAGRCSQKKEDNNGAGGGIWTHEPLQDRRLRPTPLAMLGDPRSRANQSIFLV